MLGPNLSYKGNRISPMQFAIMLQLHKDRMYGYHVLKGLREHFAGCWDPQTGAVYPALKKLLEHGLLMSETSEDEKEYYHLSPEGVSWLRDSVLDISGGAMVGMRFMSLVLEVHKEMGLPIIPHNPHGDWTREERMERLQRMRNHLLEHLEKIDDAIKELEEEI